MHGCVPEEEDVAEAERAVGGARRSHGSSMSPGRAALELSFAAFVGGACGRSEMSERTLREVEPILRPTTI